MVSSNLVPAHTPPLNTSIPPRWIASPPFPKRSEAQETGWGDNGARYRKNNIYNFPLAEVGDECRSGNVGAGASRLQHPHLLCVFTRHCGHEKFDMS